MTRKVHARPAGGRPGWRGSFSVVPAWWPFGCCWRHGRALLLRNIEGRRLHRRLTPTPGRPRLERPAVGRRRGAQRELELPAQRLPGAEASGLGDLLHAQVGALEQPARGLYALVGEPGAGRGAEPVAEVALQRAAASSRSARRGQPHRGPRRCRRSRPRGSPPSWPSTRCTGRTPAYWAWLPERCGAVTSERATAAAASAPWSERTRCRQQSRAAALPAEVTTSP